MTARDLIDVASNLAKPFTPSTDCTAGTVAAALLTKEGHMYTGVCIDAACSLGFCAEHSAVAEMLKARESEIATIVAVDHAGVILPPCGRCRELMWQVNPANAESQVVLSHDRTVALKVLLPLR